MKRRGFLKFLGMAAAVPVVAPLAEKCLRAEQPKPESRISEADKWRKLCGYGRESGATLSTVSVNALADPFAFKVGETITIGDDPTLHVITKTYRHGEQS